MNQTSFKTDATAVASAPRVTKKERILELFKTGTTSLDELARITGARPSYIGSVLQGAGLMTGYFDLYTTTRNPMNVYSKLFVNKLGFRNVETARRSVAELDRVYTEFAVARDRAGQHHALEMGLVMFNRARWTNKTEEAGIFRQWLAKHLRLDDEAETPEQFELVG